MGLRFFVVWQGEKDGWQVSAFLIGSEQGSAFHLVSIGILVPWTGPNAFSFLYFLQVFIAMFELPFYLWHIS